MHLSTWLARLGFAVSLLGVAAAAAGCSSGGSAAPKSTITITNPPTSAVPTTVPTTGPAATTPAGVPTTAPASGGVTSGAAGAARPCATGRLHVGTGASEGTAGSIDTNLTFTNTSGLTCALTGYPGVSLVSSGSSAGSQVGADAKRLSTGAVHSVTLRPGQVAHAVLGVAQAGNFPAGKCRPVTAHWLKVFPPNQRAADYVHFTTMTCASTSVHTMTIGTVKAGP